MGNRNTFPTKWWECTNLGFELFFSESLVFGAPPVKFYDLAYYFV